MKKVPHAILLATAHAKVGEFDLPAAFRAATEEARPAALKLCVFREDLAAFDEIPKIVAPIFIAAMLRSIDAHDVRRLPRHRQRAWKTAKVRLKAVLPSIGALVAAVGQTIFAEEKELLSAESSRFEAEVEDAFG